MFSADISKWASARRSGSTPAPNNAEFASLLLDGNNRTVCFEDNVLGRRAQQEFSDLRSFPNSYDDFINFMFLSEPGFVIPASM